MPRSCNKKIKITSNKNNA